MRQAIILCVYATISLFSVLAHAFEPNNPECIAPAKPEGGHDITCRLLATSIAESLLIPMSIRYMPGGIGALSYNYAINVRSKDANMVVAASTGSLLNLALRKYGKYSEADVRWLGAVGTDYGVIAVRSDAPWQNLAELIAAIKSKPDSMVIGGSGSIGSQDWIKMALTLDHAGIDPKTIRYISYEGGGEAAQALLKGHTQIFPGEFTEVVNYLDSGRMRIFAVFASRRLPGKYAFLPTAIEQGYDVVWPLWRGYYLPPKISREEYHWWVNTLYRLEATEAFTREREKLHLFPMAMIGDEFDAYVKENVRQLRETAKKFGLVP